MKNNMGNYLMAVIGVAAFSLGSLAWTGDQQNPSTQYFKDTVPSRQKSAKPSKDYKKDFDKELDELNRAMIDIKDMPDIDFSKIQEEINASMKKLEEDMANHKFDMEQMQKELKASLSKIDMEKMQADLNRSLKDLDKLDFEKIQKELKESLSKIDNDEFRNNLQNSLKEIDKIDLEKMKREIEKAMKDLKVNVNAEELQRNIQESLSKVDMEKIKVDMEKAKEEMEKNKFEMKLDMDKMHKDLDKAKKELKGYQEMVYEMENDGLLDTHSDYSIIFKNGELTINGKKQTSQVTNKYKKYFSKDGITIKKEKGEMNINIQ